MAIDPEYWFCGEPLNPAQLQLIVEVARRYPRLSRNELAHTICELLDWHRPNGGLKTAECRLLLEQLQQHRLISLPTLRQGRPRGAATSVATSASPELTPVCATLQALQPVGLQPVQTPAQRRLWRELIERYHYLGHRVPFGAHLRYLIQAAPPHATLLGCLQFSSPAWRMRARDAWIGWNDATRAQHLQHIINNSRFLILPHVQVKNLASHVLALALRTVISDWESAYGIRPYLAETLVDTARFTGHCYRAANWIDVGHTTGRGRQDRYHERHDACPKRVLLYPLVPEVRSRLQQIS
jgi:hypothetical protein